MNIPIVKNNEDLKIRRDYTGCIVGPPDTADEAMVAGKVNVVSRDEREIADTFIKLDGSGDDLDRRPGYVTISRHFESYNPKESYGTRREGIEGASVSFDPATGQPLRMTRAVETDLYYEFHRQRQHVSASSTVTWKTDGTLTGVDEQRHMTIVDSGTRMGNSLTIEEKNGVLTYEEKYLRGR